MHPIDALAQPLLYCMLVALAVLVVCGAISSYASKHCLHFWRWRHPHFPGRISHCNQCCRRNSFKAWA